MFDGFPTVDNLSLSECISLLYVSTSPDPSDLPPEDACKLMDLGLAKISNGRFAYTQLGEEIAAWTARMSDAPLTTIH